MDWLNKDASQDNVAKLKEPTEMPDADVVTQEVFNDEKANVLAPAQSEIARLGAAAIGAQPQMMAEAVEAVPVQPLIAVPVQPQMAEAAAKALPVQPQMATIWSDLLKICC